MKIIYGPQRTVNFGLGWSRTVTADGVEYVCSTSPGKRVRLAYSKKFGYHWHGTVVRVGQGVIWTGRCDKDASCKTLLEDALEHQFQSSVWGLDPFRRTVWSCLSDNDRARVRAEYFASRRAS